MRLWRSLLLLLLWGVGGLLLLLDLWLGMRLAGLRRVGIVLLLRLVLRRRGWRHEGLPVLGGAVLPCCEFLRRCERG